jgi:GT2 family glycosyltransferase/SAM-dependent methyltransferase
VDAQQPDGHVDRLIEWTGERCVPWTGDLQVVYEHYHRYLLARPLVGGKRVLDLASGEGYGSALLAQTAAEVVGLEIDPPSVAHSQATYDVPGLSFVEGSMLDLSRYGDGAFDVITCFEALEHVVEHEELLSGVRRVLAEDGVFLTSTPDRLIYSDHLHQHNPHHVRELSIDEFRDLLGGFFPHVRYWGQSVAVGSLVQPVEADQSGGSLVLALERDGDSWTARDAYAPTYYLAAASRSPLPDLPAQSVLVDPELSLVRRAQRAADDREDRLTRLHADELADRDHEFARLRGAHAKDLAERDAEHSNQAAARDKLRAELREVLAETRDAYAARRVAERKAKEAQAELDQLRSSLALRLVKRYQRALDAVLPLGSDRRRRYVRFVHGRNRGTELLTRRTPQLEPVEAPARLLTSGQPVVSLVIPVHGKWDYTARCLAALALDLPEVAYEVIVVDDHSPDDSVERVRAVRGVRSVVLEENVGFVKACNAGIRAARGHYVALLNNDTEPQPGWIDALVTTAERDPAVGVVGAKLVYGDGRLQEAGGIIWSDGDGWNYGRFGDPDDPAFNFVREVDYCSGAALLIRGSLLEMMGGGLDEQYAPAYYEDTDLCFAARHHGYKVLYQPAGVVVHHEGVSHGTDVVGTGIKRYQAINREKFVTGWARALTEQHPHHPELVSLARSRGRRGRIIVIDHQVPTYDRDSGSVRMWALLRLLREEGYDVTFVPENKARLEPYTTAMQQAGIEVLYGHLDLETRLAELARGTVLVVLSRARVANGHMDLVRNVMPGVPIVYDTVDLHHLREQRRADLEGDINMAGQAARSRQKELGLVARSDLTLVVADYERIALLEELPDARVMVLGNVHEVRENVPGPIGRAGLLFVGSFRHDPNVDAIVWFARDVLPLVREKRPDTVLTVVGGDVVPEVQALHGDAVRVLGWVPDLAPHYDAARVVVAPLRYGAGVKGKVGEALGEGVPVVSTAVGAEGMGLIAGEDLLLAESPSDLADAVHRLLEDDELWARLSLAGRRAVDRQYGRGATRRALQGVLAITT